MNTRTNDSDRSWTVGAILQASIAFLKQRGIESPRLDSEILLAHVLGCPRIRLYTDFETVVDEERRAAMRELLRRRAAAEPVAYLVGQREFFSLPFYVTRDVLIPRPETETLLVEALARLPSDRAATLLDVGTGTGCLAVSACTQRPLAEVHAVDVCPSALAVAARNAERHAAGRIRFWESDLFAALPIELEGAFDVIVSNPPYVPTAEIDTLSADVRCHEPRRALDGGPDGLAVTRRIVQEAGRWLKPGGWLALEIDPPQMPAVLEALSQQGAYEEPQPARDLAGRMRYVAAQRRSDSGPKKS